MVPHGHGRHLPGADEASPLHSAPVSPPTPWRGGRWLLLMSAASSLASIAGLSAMAELAAGIVRN